MAQILMYEDKPFSYIASGRGINYDNTISGLTATNIQDAIDEIAQGGGSGGHTIIDDSGVSQTQRPALKFDGVYTHDDSTNSRTQVDIVREFQSKAAIEALTGEEAKGFQYLDDDQYDAFTASEISFDNSDTSFTGNDVQEVLEEVDSELGTIDNSINLLNAKIQRKEFLQTQNLAFNDIPSTCTGLLLLRSFTSSASGFWFLIPVNVYSGSAVIDTPLKTGSYAADPTGASYSNGTLTVTMSTSTGSYFATLIYGG